jgi:hypothetical protein
LDSGKSYRFDRAIGMSKHLHIAVVEIFRFVLWKVFELKNKESFNFLYAANRFGVCWHLLESSAKSLLCCKLFTETNHAQTPRRVDCLSF